MLEQRSALAAAYQVGRIGVPEDPPSVIVYERLARSLVQVSGWPDSFHSVCQKLERLLTCPMPEDCVKAVSHGDRSVFRVGPERLWLTGPSHDALLRKFDPGVLGEEAVVTELGHSRTVVRVVGMGSRVLLNRGLPIDLDDAVFAPASFAQSAIHHIPVLVHRIDLAGTWAFDAYVPREYALSFWEWLTEAAESIGCQIGKPE